MNIVIINDFAYVNGGASKIALGSARSLAEAGENVFLFTAVGPVSDELAGKPNLSVICLGQSEVLTDHNRFRAVVQGFWNTKAARRMTDLLESLDRSDTVVHVHQWAKALSSSVVRVAVKGGFKLVLTIHDFQSVCPNGILYNHSNQQICSLIPMSAECIRTHCDSRAYAHKLWRVGRQAIQNNAGLLPGGISHFISISEVSETVLGQHLPAESQFYRLSNFIDAVKEEPVDVRNNSVFVYAGRIAREKGVFLWAECARQLNEETVFIGDGHLKAEMESQYPGMKFTGWLDPAGTRAQMRRARALVFPSLWYETQGLVVGEALAMGIPCIVSDSCAAREWVANGETGLWFRNGDVNDLADKVRQLRDSPKLAGTLGREAYRRYWQRPVTIEAHVADLREIYRSIGLDNRVSGTEESLEMQASR